MLTPEQYARALYEAVSETSAKDHDKVLDNFARILSENGDASKFPEIEREYERIEKAAKGIQTVEITTARSDVSAKNFVSRLNELLGSKAEVKQKVDAGIIGGVILRSGETYMDASVKKTLEDLRKQMVK